MFLRPGRKICLDEVWNIFVTAWEKDPSGQVSVPGILNHLDGPILLLDVKCSQNKFKSTLTSLYASVFLTTSLYLLLLEFHLPWIYIRLCSPIRGEEENIFPPSPSVTETGAGSHREPENPFSSSLKDKLKFSWGALEQNLSTIFVH